MYDKTIKTSITNTQSPQIISTKSKTVSKITISPTQSQPNISYTQTQVDREVDDTRESIDTMTATTTPTLDTRAANEDETNSNNNNSEVLSPDTPRFSQFMDYITGNSSTSETAQADTTTNATQSDNTTARSSTLPSLSTSQSYNPANYQYSKRYNNLSNPNYTTSINSKTKVGKRCYRLNIERPFDIHCEQSPLVCVFVCLGVWLFKSWVCV